MIRGEALRRTCSFVAAALLCVFARVPALAQGGTASTMPSFGHAVVVRENGEPVLTLDGKPFFFVGGAFFYERIPRSRWREAMLRMRELGANTLDLYVPWNWHELADGDFDFTGRTSPRRDLREVLRLGKELGFAFVVRPGPVIRNEWRNGGYPAWLLQRRAYGMPLHDVLEGRYPATATLQNAHSDDAAAEWMRNATHLRYASRWLHRALQEFKPVADRVLAVQLDDDQGAYLDNDTYPAPHLHTYLHWLEAQAREVVGPRMPVFINTFEMKVPASSPVWAMGNWYQSDAYKIGEHDRAELAFATATLRTQNRGPLAYSEFQAGWLAGPEDPAPRPADPSNTSLALGELAGWGGKGVIDFPLLDTLAPFGWEAPFSNALYAWDAAVPLDLQPSVDVSTVRWLPTRRAFRALAFYGPTLAEAHRVADVALLYDGRGEAFRAAAALKADLAACRASGIACDVVDPRAVSDARLRDFRFAVVPPGTAAETAFAARAQRLGLRVAASVDATGAPGAPVDAALLRGPHGSFLVVENWSDVPLKVDPATFARKVGAFPPFIVAPRDARIAALDVDLSSLSPRFARGDRLTTSCDLSGDGDVPALTGTLTAGAGFGAAQTCAIDATVHGVRLRRSLNDQDVVTLTPLAGTVQPNPYIVARPPPPAPLAAIRLAPNATFPLDGPAFSDSGGVFAERRDVFEDGFPAIVLGTRTTGLMIEPQAGARVVGFGRWTGGYRGLANLFDATGGLRDDVLVQPPPSPTDRIAKYTHTYPAGTFNRRYDGCTFKTARGAGAYLAYDAPDVVPHGARFERVLAVAADAMRLIADERFTPHGAAPDQRLVSLTALARMNDPTVTLDDGAIHPSAAASALDPSRGGVTFLTTLQPGPRAAPPGVAVLRVSWRPGDVEAASWAPARSNGTLRLVLAPGGWRRLTFASSAFGSAAEGAAFAEAERAWVAANRPPSGSEQDGEVAKRYTQSPQKRPSESSCGFESHLP